MPDLVAADRHCEHQSLPSVVDAGRRYRRRVISIVGRRSRCHRPRRPSTRHALAGLLAVLAATALDLQAQSQNPALTFDAALSVAMRQNATPEGLDHQQAIWYAQHTGDAIGPQVDARCAPRPVRGPVATASGPFTESERPPAAQMLRRNLRQAFYDLALSDEELQEKQDLIDFTSEFRTAGHGSSDAEGKTSRRDALQVEIALSRSRIELICAQGRRRLALAAVNAVLNRAPDVPLTIVGDLAKPVPLPSLDSAIRLSKAVDAELRQLRQDVEVQRLATEPLLDAVPRLEAARAARERALDAGIRDRFAQIERARQIAADFEDALLPAADRVARTTEKYRSGRADVMQLLEAQDTLVDLRREYLHALHDLRLSEADVEERLPAVGVTM